MNTSDMLIEGIKADIKKIFADDFSGHDYMHSIRVYNNALMLQEKCGGSLFHISLAALLHDADDYKLSGKNNSYDNATALLKKYNISDDDIETVVGIIASVSYSAGKQPCTIEAEIVQDADRLDALGAVGIARCFCFCGSRKQPIYNIDDIGKIVINNDRSGISHFYDKLLQLSECMNTDTGKKEAIARTEFLREFLEKFYLETGYYPANR